MDELSYESKGDYNYSSVNDEDQQQEHDQAGTGSVVFMMVLLFGASMGSPRRSSQSSGWVLRAFGVAFGCSPAFFPVESLTDILRKSWILQLFRLCQQLLVSSSTDCKYSGRGIWKRSRGT
jgi:hypothetical protein